jgi:hypothetical protein
MIKGSALLLSCLTLTFFTISTEAQQAVDPLLRCSAEFYARHEYNRGLLKTNSAHQQFLMDRAMILLQMAEARAPKEPTGCRGLAYCLGPASLYSEQRALMLDRLTEFVEANGPNFPLPVCMEDGACSDCIRILGEALQASTVD